VATEFVRARTAEEIAAVQRLRHAVYVAEMGRYDTVDGGAEGRFAEPEDQRSWLFYARDGDEVVAATRMTWGGDGFSERQVVQYQLEVRDDSGRIVNVLRAGDVFGELAFLLERTRTANVDAATDDTRVLSLRERAMRQMINGEPTVAAKLLLNLSKMLCAKLVRTT
jgi:hypothetical protein